jgi:hypothetical protein
MQYLSLHLYLGLSKKSLFFLTKILSFSRWKENPLRVGNRNIAIHPENSLLLALSTPYYDTCPNTGLLWSTVGSACQSVLIMYLHRRDLRTRRSENAFAQIMVSYQPHLSPYNLTCTCSSRKGFACCIATDKHTSLSPLSPLPRLTTILLVLHASTSYFILSFSRNKYFLLFVHGYKCYYMVIAKGAGIAQSV